MMDRILALWRRPGIQSAHVKPAGSDTPRDWRAVLNTRMICAGVIFASWAVAVEARLVDLQILTHDKWAARAEKQQQQTNPLPAKRGDIVDRNGRMLATSVDADTIIAVPTAIGDEAATVRSLCAAFADCTKREQSELIERLRRQRSFAYVRRQVPQDVAARVAALKLEGIGFIKESHREYPNRELAAHVLGFVGVDNRGLNGIESAYDAHIRGKDGQVLVQADARRQAFSRFEKPPTAGATVELTIDQFLQHVAERELHAGVVENHAASGTAIIMDPHTGEILALANEPTFDPNSYRDSSEQALHNRAVQDYYEPGSTFKVVTASAALEEKLMPMETLIDTNPGQIHIGSRVVTEASHHNYGVLSFMDVIVKSSNVGAIRIGFKLGSDRLSNYVQKFGFGHQVSPDFPAERTGIVWERSSWTDSALASVSMGYQVGVTPLQMVSAVNSVANGGAYMEPRVVRAIYKDGRRLAVRPKVLRQTVSADTASSMTRIMEQVVERGTGTPAKIPGFMIAGKTGTANKLVSGHYTSDTYASFVGFVPSSAPVVTILVVLDSPRGANGHFGGPVSAPIFKRIAEETLRYLSVAPSINPESPILMVSDPVPSVAPNVENARVTAPVEEDPPGTVPDVLGLSARDATRKLARYGLSARIQGDGFVSTQSPLPGTPAEEGAVCHLTLARMTAHRPNDSRSSQ